MIKDINHRFTKSLQGDLKMSKSKPEGCIDLPVDIAVVKKKLMRALTGGRDSVVEQKKKGGIPEKCMIFEFYKQHLLERDTELNKVYRDCKKGKLLCGENKQKACVAMEKFMKDFSKKMERAKKNINKLKFISFNR